LVSEIFGTRQDSKACACKIGCPRAKLDKDTNLDNFRIIQAERQGSRQQIAHDDGVAMHTGYTFLDEDS
jgi:hypothetical protein